MVAPIATHSEYDQLGEIQRSMLETIIVILVILWLLGFFVVHVGSLIHFLLVLAVVVLIIRVLRGRPAV